MKGYATKFRGAEKMKVGDLVAAKKDKEAIGIVVKISGNLGYPPRSRINWFGGWTIGWWNNFDLRVISEDW
jgi:hypothetical protein